MPMTASARRIGDTLRHEVDVNGRHVILTDEPERLGGTDEAPAPHELLPATLASCISTMVAMYAQNRGWNIGETAVEVTYDPDSVPTFHDRSAATGGPHPRPVQAPEAGG